VIARLALLVALVAAAGPALAQTWTPTVFRSAFGDEVAAEQTTLVVPERHARPDGAAIRLPVVRFRSLAAHPGPPIVYLAGGPGASGLVSGRQTIFPVLMRLREAGDVVLFDQRGTGAAQPSLVTSARYDLPPDKALRGPEATARLVQLAQDAAAEMRRRGVDLVAYNTIENAEDVETLRQALGADRLVLWGHSYGSHLGLAYLKAHPDRVAKAIFGGVNDLPNRWRYPSDGDALLARIDTAVRADPRLAERIPDFLGLARRVMDRLAAHPQVVSVNGKPSYVGREELQTLIALNAGDLGFIRELPMMFARIDRGELERPAAMLQQLRAAPLDTAMRHAMHLASGVSPERAQRIAREAPGSLSGDAINFPYNNPAYASAWGVPDLGEGFRRPASAAAPVLFMDGEFDGRTSVREARETAARFPNGHFSEMGGVSHDFYGFSPAVPDAMLAFIREGRAPPPRLAVLAAEFRSPDDPELIETLAATLKAKGAEAAVSQMTAFARAGAGPYFNVNSARVLGFKVGQDLKDPANAIRLLEAADRLYPGDFSINRQLAVLYRQTGEPAKARARFEAVRAINPLAPGVEVDIAKLR
jgi:pimeloyl-ACP methyl ester carboxylesterase